MGSQLNSLPARTGFLVKNSDKGKSASDFNYSLQGVSIFWKGTHDNDTFMGFLRDAESKARICNYLNLPKETEDETIVKMAIENLINTNADVCILTMQDLLCEGTEERINTPGTTSGNWEYKLRENYKDSKFYEYLRELIRNKNR